MPKGNDRSESKSWPLCNAATRYISENRVLEGCVRASDVVAEVVGRQSGPEKRVSQLHVKIVRFLGCPGTGT